MPPARGGKPDSLVVFLHGYGSNGADLLGLASYWSKALPGTQFLAPNAPEPVPMAPGGYQWFPIARLDPNLMAQGVRGAAGALDRFLDRELERYGLDDSRLALVGFSQGTMMALHIGPRRAKSPAAVIGYSGALTTGGTLKEEARCSPPILLVHGSHDDMIPVRALFDAGQGLAAAGQGCLWHISHGVPHSIGEDGLALGGAFLQSCLKATALRLS